MYIFFSNRKVIIEYECLCRHENDKNICVNKIIEIILIILSPLIVNQKDKFYRKAKGDKVEQSVINPKVILFFVKQPSKIIEVV